MENQIFAARDFLKMSGSSPITIYEQKLNKISIDKKINKHDFFFTDETMSAIGLKKIQNLLKICKNKKIF